MKLLREIIQRLLHEAISLDVKPGDVILTGRFKNKRRIVKTIGTDKFGQPTINGKSILKFKIEKKMPKKKWSAKSREELKESDLRRVVRQLLMQEGMKTVDDMYSHYAKISQQNDGTVVIKVLSDGKWFYEEGYLHIKKAENEMCSGAYEVRRSSANEGWGPFLYDIAIEWTGENGLMCDRNAVSPEAMNVWNTYLESRPDIEAVDLDYARHPFLTPEDKSDDCPQNTFMRWAHDELDAAGAPHDVYHFDPKKVPEHERLYKNHWATKKYVRKDRQTPTMDALRNNGLLKDYTE